MLKFDPDLSIDELPVDIYQDLVKALSKNSNWKTVAKHVSERLGCSAIWIKDLEDALRVSQEKPAEDLLFELSIKLCTVEILYSILNNCCLIDILSILCFPEPLQIIFQPDEEEEIVYVESGKHIRLKCLANGLPKPTYQWFHDNLNISGEIFKELHIHVKDASQIGEYKCKISQINHRSEKIDEIYSRSVFVNVKSTAIKIEKQPPSYIEVKQGDCLKLNFEATGFPAPQFQWFRDNDKLKDQNSKLLQIKKFVQKDEGRYYCHVFNGISEKFTQSSTIMMDLPRQSAVAKVALLIANENYLNEEKLYTPKHDVAKVGKILTDLGFCTICFADLNFVQMKNAMELFCNYLMEGAYGLFYFAGHGFKMQENYMLATDAPKKYLRKDSICESELLSLALKNDPALFIVILDMCQTLPPVESHANIHKEIPTIKEYKGRKSLRNLLQAYSTSSYRPSFERMGNANGLYASHLCKYLAENIPITKVFEQVGKSIDSCLKGSERKQIPMFATTVTKPYRLTDPLKKGDPPEKIVSLQKAIHFSDKIIDLNFNKISFTCKVHISQFSKPFINCVKISLLDVNHWDISFYKSKATEHNNLFQSSNKNMCWLHNPQSEKGPLVISILKDGVHVGANLLAIREFLPHILIQLDDSNKRCN